MSMNIFPQDHLHPIRLPQRTIGMNKKISTLVAIVRIIVVVNLLKAESAIPFSS